MGVRGEEKVGPYRLLRLLGEGGMASVFLGEHEQSGQAVALKRVKLPSESLLPRIRREIAALSRIRHPGIVRVLDSGLEGGLPWYAMEWVEGQTLRRVSAELRGEGESSAPAGPRSTVTTAELEQTPPTLDIALAGDSGLASDGCTGTGESASRPPDRPGRLEGVLKMVRRICGPLAYLHGEGLVHRDLKPENILVRPDGRPVLVDFGLVGESGGALSREALEGGGAAGTIAYISPEQARGELVDARADLYSLGCILYELLVGDRPFVGANYFEILRQHFEVQPQAPSRSVAEIPPELDDLVLRLLAKSPRDRLGHASDVASALARLGAGEPEDPAQPAPRAYLYRPGFAGRAEAVSRLEGHLNRLREGSGGLVLIGGESGVGKTRFALEALRHFNEGEVRVLTGECFQHSPLARGTPGAVPLEALKKPLQAIADRCREWGKHEAERLVGPRVQVLESVEPAFGGIPGLKAYPALPELAPEAARARLFQALTQTLSALARDAPVLLVLDDLHWSDPLTVGWLGYLLRDGALRRTALLLIGTYRTEEQNEALQELLGSADVSQLRLGRLDEAAVGAMVVDMLALEEAPAAFVRFLGLQSEGNPFFVAEYLRTALAEGILYRDLGGRWRVRGAEAASEEAYAKLPLPTALRELVGRRLDGLSGEALRLAEAAAVLGREVDAAAVAEVGRFEESGFLRASDTLLRRQVLEEIPEGFRFVHDKIREVAYERIGLEARRELHAAAAQAVEARFGKSRYEHLVAIGRHWDSAGRADLAARYCVEAGERAAASYAAREGLEELDRAVPALEAAPLDPERGRILLRAFDARSRLRDQLGQFKDSGDDARRQAELARRLGEVRFLGRGLRQWGIARYNSGDYDEALRAFRDSVAALEPLCDAEELCWSRSWQGWIHASRGEYEVAQRCFDAALASPRAITGGPAWLHAQMQRALAWYREGKLQEALALYEDLRGRYAKMEDAYNLAAVSAAIGLVHRDLGDPERAIALLEESRGVFLRLEVPQLYLTHSHNAGLILYDRGAYAHAVRVFREVEETARRHGEVFLAAGAGVCLGSCELHAGRFGVASAWVEKALEVFRELGDRRWHSTALAWQGWILGVLGEETAAERCFAGSLRLARALDSPLEIASRCLEWASARIERRGLTRRSGALANEAFRLARGRRSDVHATRAELLISLHERDWSRWTACLERLLRSPVPARMVHRSLLLGAQVALETGQRRRVHQCLRAYQERANPEDLLNELRGSLLWRKLATKGSRRAWNRENDLRLRARMGEVLQSLEPPAREATSRSPIVTALLRDAGGISRTPRSSLRD